MDVKKRFKLKKDICDNNVFYIVAVEINLHGKFGGSRLHFGNLVHRNFPFWYRHHYEKAQSPVKEVYTFGIPPIDLLPQVRFANLFTRFTSQNPSLEYQKDFYVLSIKFNQCNQLCVKRVSHLPDDTVPLLSSYFRFRYAYMGFHTYIKCNKNSWF